MCGCRRSEVWTGTSLVQFILNLFACPGKRSIRVRLKVGLLCPQTSNLLYGYMTSLFGSALKPGSVSYKSLELPTMNDYERILRAQELPGEVEYTVHKQDLHPVRETPPRYIL